MVKISPSILAADFNNLEKEVMNLQNKILKLENTPMPLSDNYTSSYQPNTYNMM